MQRFFDLIDLVEENGFKATFTRHHGAIEYAIENKKGQLVLRMDWHWTHGEAMTKADRQNAYVHFMLGFVEHKILLLRDVALFIGRKYAEL